MVVALALRLAAVLVIVSGRSSSFAARHRNGVLMGVCVGDARRDDATSLSESA